MLVVFYIIDMVLNHKLTNVKSMTAQGMSLKHISMVNLTKMVCTYIRMYERQLILLYTYTPLYV